ncbi:golgi to ER traffic protein 4 like protein [Ditylenchus destructor]|nr:golgi to ER traffic protein 4 like protein [Ditylenchus destructor]
MHYPVANSPEEFAEFLVDYQQKMSVEIDTLIVQTVFQILCYKKLKSAIIVFQKYTSGHPDIGPKTPYDFELINFVWLMLRSIAQRNLAYFTELVETYQQVLARDSNYFSYLDKIGQLYLSLPPASNCQSRSQGGFLGNLLKEFIGQKPIAPEIVDENEEFDEALATDPFVVGPLPPGVLSEQDVDMSASTSGTPSPSKSAQLPEKHEADMDLD